MVMIFEKKKEFVEGTLSACMVEANIGVDHLMYSAESEGGMEIVTICYDDGWMSLETAIWRSSRTFRGVSICDTPAKPKARSIVCLCSATGSGRLRPV